MDENFVFVISVSNAGNGLVSGAAAGGAAQQVVGDPKIYLSCTGKAALSAPAAASCLFCHNLQTSRQISPKSMSAPQHRRTVHHCSSCYTESNSPACLRLAACRSDLGRIKLFKAYVKHL